MPLSFFDYCKTVRSLVKEKKYREALDYFKENKVGFTNEKIAGNGFLVSDMLSAMRHTDKCSHAFKFLDFYDIKIDDNTDERILNSYGWLLYSTFKSENIPNETNQNENDTFDDDEAPDGGIDHHFNKSEIIERIENYFPLILKFSNDFNYSVVSNLFIIVLKIEKKKPSPSWKFINEFCCLISPDYLKTECRAENKEIKGVIKNIEYASDKENWYAYKSKALIKLEMFQECYEISKKALELFNNFHYSNDVWFARRIALSKNNLGNPTDAIAELLLILQRKKEWFIQKELADLYKEAGDYENAFKFAILAINNFGDLEYKIELLFLLGELLKEKKENELAFKHFSLSHLIRVSKDWKINQKLLLALGAFEKEPIPLENLQALKRDLKKYWDSFNKAPERSKGKVTKILHKNEKGVDGFIEYGSGKSIYFKANQNEKLIDALTIGIDVEFQIIPPEDGKKERAIKLKQI